MAARHFAWQAWHLLTSTFVLRGRRSTWRHPPSFCVAISFVLHAIMTLGWLWWRAWAPLVARGAAGTLRGRRGAWRPPLSFCVAVVALAHIHLRFAWQAWHLQHWAGSMVGRLGAVSRPWHRGTLRGRR